MRYLCNNLTELHNIQCDSAENVSKVIGCYKFQFQNSKMRGSRHLENRQNALSHDDAERVSQAYQHPPS